MRVAASGLNGGARRACGAASPGAVVVTVTVTEAAPDPLGVTEEGLTVQVACDGAPVQAKLIVWFRPPRPLSESA